MPCESSLHECWTSVTGIWLMHRLVATLGFVLGLTLVVTLAVKSWVQSIDQTTAAAVAAAASLLAGFYLTRARSVMAFSANPPLCVGDAVEVIDEQTEHVRRYYVQDVSLEGIKLLEVTEGDHSPKRCDPVWPSHDRMLDLPDALKMLRTRRRFGPCRGDQEGCKRVNPHCRHRPALEARRRILAKQSMTRGLAASWQRMLADAVGRLGRVTSRASERRNQKGK